MEGLILVAFEFLGCAHYFFLLFIGLKGIYPSSFLCFGISLDEGFFGKFIGGKIGDVGGGARG